MNTQLRKQASNHKNVSIHIDLFHFDFEAMTFYVGDSKVELSKTEQKLLRLLVENRGRTMTRGDLVDRIWTDGAEYVASEKEPVMAASSILSISSIVFLTFLRSHNTTAIAVRKHSSMITMPVLFIFCHPAITDCKPAVIQ